MNDYNIQLKLRNGKLLNAIRSLGYATSAEFCRDRGVSPQILSHYLNFKMSPTKSKGGFTESFKKIAKAIGKNPMDLLPEEFVDRAIGINKLEYNVSYDDVQHISDAREELTMIEYQEDANTAIDMMSKLDKLSLREKDVVCRRYGIGCPEESLDTIGKDFGVTRERVRQIENRAIRKLKQSFYGYKNV